MNLSALLGAVMTAATMAHPALAGFGGTGTGGTANGFGTDLAHASAASQRDVGYIAGYDNRCCDVSFNSAIATLSAAFEGFVQGWRDAGGNKPSTAFSEGMHEDGVDTP